MSPDRTTITRAEAIRRRKDEEQKQREKLTQRNVTKPRTPPAPKVAAKSAARTGPKISASARSVTAATNQWQRRYDIAMSSPYRRATSSSVSSKPKSTPRFSISLPNLRYGPRWFSFFIAIFCLLDLYLALNSSMYVVSAAKITGNQRVSAAEIQSMLGIANLPAVYLDPSQIQVNILAAFPDIASADVKVGLPNTLTIKVEERKPIASWQQDGQTVWVDTSGYAFTPRGQVDGLTQIVAAGAPPTPANIDPNQTYGARPFLTADLTNTIQTLSADLPAGAAMVYDPQYGLGWSDPKGWKVYFGLTNADASLKLKVYQSMLEYLSKKNIQPTMISVEYPNAPFYRTEP